MKAKRGTWHYRLNDYFFGYGYSEDNHNVCPYFWATLLAVGLGWLKWIIQQIPHVDLPSLSYEQKDRIGRLVFWCVTAVILTGVIAYGTIVSWYDILTVLTVLGIATGSSAGIVFAIMLGKERYDKWRYNHPKKNKPRKEPKPNILKEQVGGWYHKHCPMLEWTDD